MINQLEKQTENSDDSNDANEKQDRSIAEWVTFGISLAILLGLVGLVLYLALTKGDKPINLEAKPQLEMVRQTGDNFYLPVEISNLGDETAEEVEVEVILTAEGDGGGKEETRQFTIQFLPRRATEEGYVIFQTDPRKGNIKVVIHSYIDPN
jgi:uncharacterized protein (TIGR02588 family)